MSHLPNPKTLDPEPAADYASWLVELAGLLTSERDWLVNLANTSAFLNQRLTHLNWVGFYLWRDGQLVLGPFQGKPACTRIARGRGVCGAAAAQHAAIIVPDVCQFPGHIACDAASASEIVVPIEIPGRQIGVLDLDSPRLARFGEKDRAGLESLVRLLAAATDWPDFLGDAKLL
jgi:GAF domain-containing protein